jgi:hypothetical protein
VKKTSNFVSFTHFLWLFCIILAISGLTLAIQSIVSFHRATIILEWSTASELDTVGFNVFRGDSETGPFTKINQQVISPSNDPLVGGNYVFEDSSAQAGKTYYYILEDVEATGATNQHRPVTQKAQNTSKINLILSGILIIAAGYCIWTQTRKPGRILKT